MNKTQLNLILTICLIGGLLFGAKSCIGRSGNKTKIGSSDIPVFTINAPSNLSATAISFTQINLSWSDNSNNEDGFEIWRSIPPTNTDYSLLATVPSGMLSYSDTSVTSSNIYYYRVRAYNTIGDYSVYSNEANAFAFDYAWLPPFVAVVAGIDFSLALASNGTLWAWGLNNLGQLGIGDFSNRILPNLIASDFNSELFNNIAVVDAYNHVIARKTNGTLWAWGANESSQLGLGDDFDTPAPAQIGTDSDWSIVSAGGNHTLALKTTGTMWSWGDNTIGQLGLGDTIMRTTPTQVGTQTNWFAVTAGLDYTIGLKTNPDPDEIGGTIWAWGWNYSGQLGLGDYGEATRRKTPSQVGAQSDWSAVSAGTDHTIALKTDRTLWVWGDNWYGQLGFGTSGWAPVVDIPNRVWPETDWSRISAGYYYTTAIKANSSGGAGGTLWSWGRNSSISSWFTGQLGREGDQTRPGQVGTQTDWSIVSAGYIHTIALTTNGSIWVWGNNGLGQLGLGDNINRTIPYPLGGPIAPVSLSLIVISSSQINLSWTDNSFNETGFIIERKTGVTGEWQQIGTVGANITSYSDAEALPGNTYYYRVCAYNSFGNSLYSNEPSEIPILFSPSILPLRVISSAQINVFWADNSPDESGFQIERKIDITGTWGTTFTVGANVTSFSDTTVSTGNTYYYRVRAFNALTTSEYTDETTPALSTPSNLLLSIASANQIDFSWLDNSSDESGFQIERRISTGTWDTVFIVGANVTSFADTTVSPGNIYYYHVRAFNAFINSAYSYEITPSLANPTLLTIISISTTQINLSWQDNSSDEDGFKIERKTTRYGTWIEIGTTGAGITTYSDITPDGFAPFTYYYRVKAYNNFANSAYSNEITAAISGNWSVTAGGDSFTLALKSDDTLWEWGDNQKGQLGLGNTTKSLYPIRVGIDSDWVKIAAGNAYTINIKANGTIWGWGDNYSGQLGINQAYNYKKTPTQIGTQSDWSAVAAGNAHTLAVKTNGTLWAWGGNYHAALGDGTVDNRFTPRQIGIDSDWAIVEAGYYYSLALKTNSDGSVGTLWAWGWNSIGQLGLGDYTQRNTPTQIGNQSDWMAITAGTQHTISLKTNGTIWSWGSNYYGSLGLGDTLDRNMPTQIGIQTQWSKVAVGSSHTVTLKRDGTIWVWGYNLVGQLGLGDSGDVTQRLIPTQLGNQTDWITLGAGGMHSLAIKTNGTLWAWGYNGSGELGLGDKIDKNIPTLVGE
jgi:alpha-tubulin suppressor-like RCC1 family protein